MFQTTTQNRLAPYKLFILMNGSLLFLGLKTKIFFCYSHFGLALYKKKKHVTAITSV